MTAAAIRDGVPGDREAIRALYAAAFPEEDLVPLVTDLIGSDACRLSLVAAEGDGPVGHIAFTDCAFTDCAIAGCADRAVLLGPLAVAPARQRQGIGSALVRAGFARIAAGGPVHVFVLGDPAWYGRLGFAPETRVAPPYPLPEAWRAAWQSVRLGGAAPARGTLSVPAPWNQAALWAPPEETDDAA